MVTTSVSSRMQQTQILCLASVVVAILCFLLHLELYEEQLNMPSQGSMFLLWKLATGMLQKLHISLKLFFGLKVQIPFCEMLDKQIMQLYLCFLVT